MVVLSYLCFTFNGTQIDTSHMTIRSFALRSIALAAVVCLGQLSAEVEPNRLFTDGAVLQRGRKLPVWGTANDGEKVTVEFNGQKAETVTKDGK